MPTRCTTRSPAPATRSWTRRTTTRGAGSSTCRTRTATRSRSSVRSADPGPHMKRVLVTGMSGVGKSTVARELAARGFGFVDTDEVSHWVDTGTGRPAPAPAAGEEWGDVDFVWD